MAVFWYLAEFIQFLLLYFYSLLLPLFLPIFILLLVLICIAVEAKKLRILRPSIPLLLQLIILLKSVGVLPLGVGVNLTAIPILSLEVSDLLIDILQDLRGLVLELIHGYPYPIDTLQDLYVLHLIH